MRHIFGGRDTVVFRDAEDDLRVLVGGSVPVHAAPGGALVTDVTDLLGVTFPGGLVPTNASGGIDEFQGPDNDAKHLYVANPSTLTWFRLDAKDATAGLLTQAAADAVYAPTSLLAINAKSPAYGAQGDGIAIDTSALQAALAAAPAFGAAVYAPRGTYLTDDKLVIDDSTWFFGDGEATVIKSLSLVNGGAGVGHRQIEAVGKTGFRISDMVLDASGMTVFAAGMRSIYCLASTGYQIRNVHFKTPGAAIASIGCSDFVIDRPVVDVISSNGVAQHDGVIDQWGGCYNFDIIHPVVNCNGIGKYGILVTGEDTAGLPAGCHDFTITVPRVNGAKYVAIWINGREGINRTFTIDSPRVNGVTEFFGIAISDSQGWTLSSPVTRDTGSNGIRVYSETSAGGTTGGQDGTITGPVVENANVAGSASGTDGAAIAVLSNSDGVTVSGARVAGSGHTWALIFQSTTTNCRHSGGSYQAGTLGKVSGDPNGGTYSPALTAVANVAASTAHLCRWSRVGDVVTVNGRVQVTPTAAGSVATQLGISLPVPSAFTDVSIDCSGHGNSSFGVVAAISADITNDRAQLQFPAPNTTNNIIYYSFQYTVLP